MAKQTFTTGQVLTAAQVNSLQTNDFNQTVSAKTASYVLVAADKGTRIEFNTSGSVTCTVNTGIFDAGDTLIVQNRGAGAVTITAGTATVNTSGSLVVNQYESGTLYFISASAALWFGSNPGDITGITTGASSGLTGGVTSGTADLKLNTAAKGDLLVGTGAGTVSALSVGNNGETLVADSSATTGLRWQSAANANAVINGGMDIWQRGTSFAGASSGFCADRWRAFRGAAGSTFSRQSSSLTGIQYALRMQRDSGNTSTNGISTWYTAESADAYRFAGQTVTLSFWARAGANFSAASSNIVVLLQTGTGTDQAYGSFTGASNIVNTTQAITTSWVRYSFTASVASTATQFAIEVYYNPVGTAGANDWMEVTGFQLEVGSVATTFKRAGVTLAGELAACQRYYYDHSTGNNLTLGVGFYFSSSDVRLYVKFPVTMRTTPTVVATSGTNYYCVSSNGADDFINSLIIARGAASGCLVYNNSEAAGTSGYAGEFRNANASASLAFNAEL